MRCGSDFYVGGCCCKFVVSVVSLRTAAESESINRDTFLAELAVVF
jgi:hypothetical protein